MQIKPHVSAQPESLKLQPPKSDLGLGPWAPIVLILGARGSERVRVRFYLDRSGPFVFRNGSRRLKTAWRKPVTLADDWKDIGKGLVLEKFPAEAPTPPTLKIEVELVEVADPGNALTRPITVPVEED